MRTYLVTGGSGFFGGILKREIISRGDRCVNIDLYKDPDQSRLLVSVQGDIRNRETVEKVFSEHCFDAVFHCAAILAHDVKDRDFLWTSNVDGTETIANACVRHGVDRLVFTSSNCLWAAYPGHPVDESAIPNPVEIYGRSKLAGEEVLQRHADRLHSMIIRCPTIVDSGRLGLLAILFEFIDEGRMVWTVGGGRNRYQFIYAMDLVDACLRCVDYDRSNVFHIGSDNVKPLRDVFSYVIERSNRKARVVSLPKTPAILAMKAAYHLGISPLGPYQYKMIAEDFIFSTDRIKSEIGWRPSLTNEEMLFKSYEFYRVHRAEIEARKDVSAHSRGAQMGVIRVLKWLS